MVKRGQPNTITWNPPYVYEKFLFLVFVIQTVFSVRYALSMTKLLSMEHENKVLSQKNWFIICVA